MLGEEPLSSILSAGELAYLAVTSKSGPMVTPVLFTASDGRVWTVMPRASAKIAAIGRSALVGVTISTPAATAVLQGRASLVDPLDPRSLVTSLPETIRSPRAAGSYLAGNLKHLPDVLGAGVLTRRAMAAVRPERALAVSSPGDVWTSGAWPVPTPRTTEADADGTGGIDVDLGDAPSALREATARPTNVVVGWTTDTGPVAVPGDWDPARGTASIRRDVFDAVGASASGPACVLFDLTDGTSLDAKTGLVLRGHAVASDHAGDVVECSLRADRVTWWHGDRSQSVSAH